MAIAEYLTKLDALRDDLARNLAYMGVTATADETLDVLVPKVLDILTGDPSAELLKYTINNAELASTVRPTAYFGDGERVTFGDALTVNAANRITIIKIMITSVPVGLSQTFTVSGDGWTGQVGTSNYVASFPLTRATRGKVIEALKAFSLGFTGSDSGDCTLEVSAVAESGAEIAATGTISFKLRPFSTWEIAQAKYPKWTDVSGLSWKTVESLKKQDVTL